MVRGFALVVLVLLTIPFATADATEFDLEAYRRHLEQNAALTYDELFDRHAPVGPYLRQVEAPPGSVAFLDSVVQVFDLSGDERVLIDEHGFVVSERLQFRSHGEALRRVWHADLPVFLSSDLFLHAFHRSFDDILQGIEISTLIPELDGVLGEMRDGWPALAATHAANANMATCLADVDLYLSVALNLLRGGEVPALDPGNTALFASILASIDQASGMEELALFNDVPRLVDFSQFEPRGHYTDSPVLERYFRSMMWLGRIDFRLSIPPGVNAPASVQREVVGAFLLRELVESTGVRSTLDRIDDLLRVFIGQPDNTTLADLEAMRVELELADASSLWDPGIYEDFEALLASDAYQPQAINSRILLGDPMSGDPLDPPYAFLLMGQRFTIDSNVLGNVVYDRIEYQGQRPFRGLPDPIDVLYALGNDDVLPLLQAEIEAYHYAPNLSALRYLIDSYDDGFWASSLYTHWLAAIRTLSRTGEIAGVPDFMRTGAWQQQKMNTQLASWAELRHDTILYVKQSYTSGVICSYPHAYVEPVPELYRSLQHFAEFGVSEIVPRLNPGVGAPIAAYFERAATLMSTVATIAQKELDGVPFSEDEDAFLQGVLFASSGCSLVETGWLPDLYFCAQDCPAPVSEPDRIIADVHTQPTDESGSPVGKVLHVATANPMLGIFVATCPGGSPTAFVGPVASYRELIGLGFQRLTDDDWTELFDWMNPSDPIHAQHSIPATEVWTHVYLADADGARRVDAPSILDDGSVATGGPGETPDETPVVRTAVSWVTARPNPFNPSTVIGFELAGTRRVAVRLEILDTRGRRIATLVDEGLDPGTYLIPWRGTDASGRPVASGVYLGRVLVEGRASMVKLALVR